MPGSARGLRIVPCISAPAAPRAAPTSSPSSVRGTRRSRTIAVASLSSGAVKALKTSWSGIDCDPIASEASAHSATSAVHAMRTARREE